MRKGYRECVKCGRNRQDRFFVSARGRTCSTCRKRTRFVGTRDQRLQETYGISELEYQKLLDAQGGRCAICRGVRPGSLDVDHDHAHARNAGNVRGSVRGLLCRRCNRRLLPAAQDSVDRLEAAIEYLRYGRWNTQRVLGEPIAA